MQSSMPEKPAKLGHVSKKFLGKAIKIGYSDGPADEGIICKVDGSGVLGIEFFIPANGAIGVVDSREQIISLGEAKIELTFPD